jgi:hypothetical protein
MEHTPISTHPEYLTTVQNAGTQTAALLAGAKRNVVITPSLSKQMVAFTRLCNAITRGWTGKTQIAQYNLIRNASTEPTPNATTPTKPAKTAGKRKTASAGA